MVFKKNYTKNRWNRARQLQQFHEEKTGEKLGLRTFYKNSNPVTNNITMYEVTLEMSHNGEGYEFFIPQESFSLTSYENGLNQDEIVERTKQAVSNIFKGGSRDWMYNNLNVQLRGIEEIRTEYNKTNLNNLVSQNNYFDNVPTIEVNKSRKGAGKNTNKYNLNL